MTWPWATLVRPRGLIVFQIIWLEQKWWRSDRCAVLTSPAWCSRAVSVSAVLHGGQVGPRRSGGALGGAAGRADHLLSSAEHSGGAAHGASLPGGGYHRPAAAQWVLQSCSWRYWLERSVVNMLNIVTSIDLYLTKKIFTCFSFPSFFLSSPLFSLDRQPFRV